MSHALTCDFIQLDTDGAVLATSSTTATERGHAAHAWRDRVMSILTNPITQRTFMSAGPSPSGSWHLETREDWELSPIGQGFPFRFTTITRLEYKEVT